MAGSETSGKVVYLELARLRFPSHRDRFDHLCSVDPRFRQLCEDYVAALAALEASSNRPEHAQQFHCIAIEAEWEIEALLKEPGREG
jgi:hypothetical protein